jgi:cytochrome c1
MSPREGSAFSAIPVWPVVAVLGLIILTGLGWVGAQQWQRQQENVAVARALTGGDPAHANQIARRYGCAGCHAIPGLPGANGKAAPPLVDLRARVYIGGVLPNTAENLVAWIVDPRRFSPRTAMPRTGISEQEARDIAAYLYGQ